VIIGYKRAFPARTLQKRHSDPLPYLITTMDEPVIVWNTRHLFSCNTQEHFKHERLPMNPALGFWGLICLGDATCDLGLFLRQDQFCNCKKSNYIKMIIACTLSEMKQRI